MVLVREIGLYFGFTAISVLSNNAVPETHLGRMNGVSSTLSSLVMFAGPAVMAPLFAWSIEEPRSFPFDKFFAFLVSGLLLVFVACLVPRIPKWLERKEQ